MKVGGNNDRIFVHLLGTPFATAFRVGLTNNDEWKGEEDEREDEVETRDYKEAVDDN